MRTLIISLLLLSFTVAAEPLTIWISSQQDKLYYEKMVKLYKEKNKDFDAKVEAFGFREMPEKLAIALKSGIDVPDICQLDEVLFGIYLQGKVPFVDLTERIKKANLDKTILKQRLDLFTWQKKTYALPQSVSAYVVYYRKDLFKEEGIKPEDLKTWKDVEKVGKKLADNGIGLMAIDPTFFGVYLRQRGGKLFSKDGKFLPDRKLAVDTMKWIKKMVDDGIFLRPSRGSVFDPVFFGIIIP